MKVGISMNTNKSETLLHQMQEDITSFLSEHEELSFYCFAFDCNAEYAQILLCLNTEKDFQKALEHYQSGSSKQYYQTEEDIFSLRYNTGDWEYQGFANYTVYDEEELTKLYSDDYERMQSEMMKKSYDLLERLCNTQAFHNIPKTEDFTVLCIDHDEDPIDAMENTKAHVLWRKQ